MVIGCRGDKMKSLWAAAVLVLGLTLLMGCKEKKPEPEELLAEYMDLLDRKSVV